MPTMTDWLVDPDMRETTPFRYSAGDRRVKPVELVVVHWTASPPGSGKDGTNEARIRRWGQGKSGRESSTHLVVLRDGRLLQTCPLSARTWHAKGSVWTSPGGVTVRDVNSRAIALDMECVGDLERMRDGSYRDSYGGAFAGPGQLADGRWWEAYRDAQIATLMVAATLLVSVFPILKDPARWTGHTHIRKTKSDPGPHFPWATLRSHLEALP